jgi:hypothetical protein
VKYIFSKRPDNVADIHQLKALRGNKTEILATILIGSDVLNDLFVASHDLIFLVVHSVRNKMATNTNCK